MECDVLIQGGEVVDQARTQILGLVNLSCVGLSAANIVCCRRNSTAFGLVRMHKLVTIHRSGPHRGIFGS
jgi:hypothetical protein